MKFMKLGSKPDSFQTDGNNVRYVAADLETDIIVNVGDSKFHLHKFPLLSKSARLQKLANANESKPVEVYISDIPVALLRLRYVPTEYLGMHESIEKGNLIYKIDVFLNSSIFRSWKDSIIVLQTTKSLLPISEELKLVSQCIDSIATKACVMFQKLTGPIPITGRNSQRKMGVSQIGMVSETVKFQRIGGLRNYKVVRFQQRYDDPGWRYGKASIDSGCNCMAFACGERQRLFRRRAIYDVSAVQKIVEEFLRKDRNAEIQSIEEGHEIQEEIRPGILSDASKLMVAKLIDGYLAEISKDPNLPLSKFVDLAEMVSGFSRPAHDGIYRAIDMFLKEHPGISKSERKRICKLMDCKKLSVDACMHAVQNERLPLRVVVQVLFFEQVRAAASSGSSTPDLPKGMKDLNSGSHGSSRSTTTNTEEDWDAVASAEELRALKGELASLRLASGEKNGDGKSNVDKAAVNKMRGLLKSKKIFAKLFSSKGGQGENSGSDSSESLGSANPEEAAKSTPSRNRRHSVS
ncbi:hypothetical protein M0R45_007586 [Rubus argutus]|uniref:NPH3 domain-containing protein n=1 Tax=Rubus argutus TaxID=59490 RepID=A0AAW1Y135_RUBAR